MSDLDSLAAASGLSTRHGGQGRRHSCGTTQKNRAAQAPAYQGIVVGSTILYLLGGIYVLGGILFVVIGVASLAQGHGKPLPYDLRSFGGGGALLVGMGSSAVGCLIILLGSVSMAVRDIARNSFKA